MSWRENYDWRQLPNGSGDGQRKKSKTEEDGSYHTAEVSPGDRGRIDWNICQNPIYIPNNLYLILIVAF